MLGVIIQVEVWREEATTGHFSDPEWVLQGVVPFTIQPFTGDEGQYNNQMTQNVRYMLHNNNPNLDVKSQDMLKFYDEFNKVEYVQKYYNVLPHIEVFTGESQKELL